MPLPPEPPGPCDPNTGQCCDARRRRRTSPTGMAVPSIFLLDVSLSLTDTPVGYIPPVGPAVQFTVRYRQRDNQFSSTFNYSNFGLKWTFDWLAYIVDDPATPQADVTYYMRGGGNRTFTGFDPTTQTFASQRLDRHSHPHVGRHLQDALPGRDRPGVRSVRRRCHHSADLPHPGDRSGRQCRHPDLRHEPAGHARSPTPSGSRPPWSTPTRATPSRSQK